MKEVWTLWRESPTFLGMMPKEVVSIEFGLLHQYSGSNKILVVIMQLTVQERVVWLPSSNCQRNP